MERQQDSYVYGNVVARPVRRPNYNDEAEIRRRQQERKNPRKRKAQKTKVDRISLFLTIFAFAAVLAVGVYYIHLQAEVTYLGKNVVRLQNDVVEMEKKNSAAEMDLENTMDLKEIYRKATEELGMKTADKNQIYTYKSKKSTQIRQHSNIKE